MCLGSHNGVYSLQPKYTLLPANCGSAYSLACAETISIKHMAAVFETGNTQLLHIFLLVLGVSS